MRNQQQVEKEEQQRIKNLVLNLDLRDENEADGDSHPSPILPNPNRRSVCAPAAPPFPLRVGGTRHRQSDLAETAPQGIEKQPQNPYMQPRLDKAGSNARNQRARKLQLSDVNW